MVKKNHKKSTVKILCGTKNTPHNAKINLIWNRTTFACFAQKFLFYRHRFESIHTTKENIIRGLKVFHEKDFDTLIYQSDFTIRQHLM